MKTAAKKRRTIHYDELTVQEGTRIGVGNSSEHPSKASRLFGIQVLGRRGIK
jgi:hypothetical protein